MLKLRSQSVNEQNKLQDTGDEDDANECDITAATEKTLDNDDETTLRGEASLNNNISDHSWCESFRKLNWEAEGCKTKQFLRSVHYISLGCGDGISSAHVKKHVTSSYPSHY